MAFDAAERNGGFGRIQCHSGKKSSSRGKRKRRVFLCRRTARVKVEGKVHLSELSENSRKDDARWGERPEREEQIEELINDQNPGPETPPMSKKGQEKREQRRSQENSDCQRSDRVGYVCQGHSGGGCQKR